MSVPSDGCYALRVEGEGGAALSVVDRMYGEIASTAASGDPSAANGRKARATVFLESGEYKLSLFKPAESSAAVSVDRFASSEAVSSSRDSGLIRSLTLGDGQALTFTVNVGAADPTLRFFALGRSLGGAKLFRSGGWATDVEPYAGTIEVEEGRPSRWIEFNREVEPGEYRIVCWGAPELPWSGNGPKAALYVMEGERKYDEIGLFDVTIGESGLEFLSMPGSVGFAQATVPDSGVVSLSWTKSDGARLSFRSTAETDARGAYRAATLRMSASTGWKRLILRGKSGQRVGLRFFPNLRGGSFAADFGGNHAGDVAVRALGSVEGEDSVPLTARAYLLERDGRTVSAFAVASERTLSLSDSKQIRLEANLLERNSFLVDVSDTGSYAVLERQSKKNGDQKAAGRWTFFPLEGFSFNRRDAKSAKSGEAVQLDAGRYLLVVEALEPGPLDALIAREGISTKLGGLGLWDVQTEPSANEFSWYGMSVPGSDSGKRTALAVGERAGVSQGIAIRSEPIDFSEQPFAVRLDAGQSVRLKATLSRPSSLRTNDSRLRIIINGTALDESKTYPAGEFELRCNADDGKPLWATVEALPAVEAPEAERFGSFSEGAPFWTEFARGEVKRFLLRVDSPALYTVSTTGRLDTRISLRSRMRPSFARASDGGPGRNARVSAYLKAGDYLVEVGVAGDSRGAAGVSLERRSVRDLSALRRDGRVRATAEAGEALAVPVRIDSEGEWSLASFGLGRSFSYRFEDSLGWPIGEAVGTSGYAGYLSQGNYRFISLDDQVSTRRVFTLVKNERGPSADPYSDAESARTKRSRAALGTAYRRSWRGEGHDELVLELSAPVSVTMSLSDDMAYKATAPDGSIVSAGLGADSVALELPAGATTFGFKPMLDDQDHAYSVRFDCPDLMENRPLSVGPGSVIPLSVGRPGVWELETGGPQELEAALFAPGANGYSLVATSRVIEDDWNCVVSSPLDAGRYLVKFASPGDPRLTEAPSAGRLRASGGSSSVLARYRANAEPLRRTGAFSLTAEIGGDFAVVDFVPEKTGPYRFAADSADSTELYIEKAGKPIAYGKNEAWVVLSSGVAYRLRCGRSGEGVARVGLSCAPLSFAEVSIGGSDSIESAESALLVRDPKRMSRFLSVPGAIVAFGADSSFRRIGGDPFRADGAWIALPDGKPFGKVSLPRASAGALSLPLDSNGQKIAVPVPEGSVALLRSSSRGFEVSLTETAERESSGAARVDWSSSAVSRDRTVLGLASGDRLVVVGDSRPEADGRIVPVSADTVPVLRREALAAGESRTVAVAARSAVAVVADRASLRVSLERGLAAFDAGVRTSATVDASDGSRTAMFDELAGTLYLVNSGGSEAIAALETLPKSTDERPVATDDDGWESTLTRGGTRSVRIDGRTGSPVVCGSVSSFRFYDEESGKAVSGERIETAAGPLLVAPGRRGLLVMETEPGFAKVYLSAPEDRLDAFASVPARSGGAPLGFGQSFGGTEGKRFTLPHSGGSALLLASATGDGVLAALDSDGAVLSASAAAAAQKIVASVDRPGSYSVFVRPFEGMTRSGTVSAEIARPETVLNSGVLPDRLISDNRTHAYRFRTAAETLAGVGVRAERDGLSVRLLDSSFKSVGEGPALIRKLPPGDYYLLVSSDRGTVRYSPVFFGIEGSKADTPEEVVAQYLRNGEEE